MKNIFKLFSLIVVLLVTMVACEEETEWFGDYNGEGAVYAQFADTDWELGLFVDAEGVPVTPEVHPVYVKLIGPAQSSDVTVGVKITESTGTNGEWSVNTSATIPAGSLSGAIMVTIDKALAVMDSTYTIELALDEATTTVPIYGNVAATASVTVKRGLLCAYSQDEIIGSYHAISADWGAEGDVTITADPDDEYVVYLSGIETIEGLVEDMELLKLVIASSSFEPNKFEVIGGKNIIASDAWGYHNIAYEGDGVLSTCDDSFAMDFAITVDEGSFGTYHFTFTKN